MTRQKDTALIAARPNSTIMVSSKSRKTPASARKPAEKLADGAFFSSLPGEAPRNCRLAFERSPSP
jgi:hypothetical protein